jgi:hypothetical protein
LSQAGRGRALSAQQWLLGEKRHAANCNGMSCERGVGTAPSPQVAPFVRHCSETCPSRQRRAVARSRDVASARRRRGLKNLNRAQHGHRPARAATHLERCPTVPGATVTARAERPAAGCRWVAKPKSPGMHRQASARPQQALARTRQRPRKPLPQSGKQGTGGALRAPTNPSPQNGKQRERRGRGGGRFGRRCPAGTSPQSGKQGAGQLSPRRPPPPRARAPPWARAAPARSSRPRPPTSCRTPASRPPCSAPRSPARSATTPPRP